MISPPPNTKQLMFRVMYRLNTQTPKYRAIWSKARRAMGSPALAAISRCRASIFSGAPCQLDHQGLLSGLNPLADVPDDHPTRGVGLNAPLVAAAAGNPGAGVTMVWPLSPAKPLLPRNSRPSMIIPEERPVLTGQ